MAVCLRASRIFRGKKKSNLHLLGVLVFGEVQKLNLWKCFFSDVNYSYIFDNHNSNLGSGKRQSVSIRLK